MSVPKRILACTIRMAIRYSCDGSRYHTHTHRNYGTLSTRARRSQTSPFNPRDAAAAHARTHMLKTPRIHITGSTALSRSQTSTEQTRTKPTKKKRPNPNARIIATTTSCNNFGRACVASNARTRLRLSQQQQKYKRKKNPSQGRQDNAQKELALEQNRSLHPKSRCTRAAGWIWCVGARFFAVLIHACWLVFLFGRRACPLALTRTRWP